MKFRYIGEVPDGVSIEMFGATFTPNGVADVTDPHGIMKLNGNPFFEAVDGPVKRAPEPVPVPDVVPEPDVLSEIDVLRSRAEELGIKVDGRWSANKLRNMIAATEGLE